MNQAEKDAAYALVGRFANIAEAGGLTRERAVLLLWYLRTVLGVDDLDAYEYVCDGPADGGIDGLFLEELAADGSPDTLVIFSSKYPTGPNDVGRTQLEGLVASADKFESAEGLRELLDGDVPVEPELVELISRFRLLERLDSNDFAEGRLRIRLVFVTAGLLTDEARAFVVATNAAHDAGYLTFVDLDVLGRIAKGLVDSGPTELSLDVPLHGASALIAGASPRRIVMAPVRASEMVTWDGIDDRTLFELNVRRELPRNPVRRQLDAAIRRPGDHPDFLAYHNGITITCRELEVEDDRLTIHQPSVVNGAQSLIALSAANKEDALTDELLIFCKFVETADRPNLAAQVSRRSNTQNPVNARNLVANTDRQKSLAAEMTEKYPEYHYETKPDASLDPPAGRVVIQNDVAAQLLCSIYLGEPWLAVKKTTLFTAEHHPRVFGASTTAAHVVVAKLMSDAVDSQHDRFPDEYRRSWQLTRLVAVYMVAQMLAATDPASRERQILEQPEQALTDREWLEQTFTRLARYAAATLRVRRDRNLQEHEFDDFKVEFKREQSLKEIRQQAREMFLTQEALRDE